IPDARSAASFSEQLAERLDRLRSIARRDCFQKRHIESRSRGGERKFGVREILGAMREELHRDEVFDADDAQLLSLKGNVERARECLRIESAETHQQVDAIAESITYAQDGGDWIVRIAVP